MRAADIADAPDIGLAGAGTAENPYLLKTAADIVALANSCAGPSGATSGMSAPHYAGIYFAIDADIDMSGIEGFYGIGTAPAGSSAGISWYFAGIIDGRGHTISNMHINGIAYDDTGKALSASKTGSRGYVGLIGTLKSPGAIGNIKLDATCTVEGYTATGSLVGQLEAGAIVSDCSSAATVRNINKNSGGIIGYMKGSSTTPAMITRCTFSGKVMENYEAAGGIAGRSERAIILRCANLGEVICESFNTARAPGKQSLGAGIAGYNYYGTVQDCLNAGRVEVSYQKAAGIVAYNSNKDCMVRSCVNLGLVECTDVKYLGAIVGHNFRSGSAANYTYAGVEDCYYDSQIWGDMPGAQIPEGKVTALATAAMTAGTPLAGLDAEKWTYAPGFYPRLSDLPDAETIRDAAATYVSFAAGESALDFTSPATVSDAVPGITATMKLGEWFSVDGRTITPRRPSEMVEDTILLTCGRYAMQVPVRNTPVTFAGAGTEADPYIIADTHDLLNLARACNSGAQEHYTGVYFRLGADLDLSSVTGFAGIASKATRAYGSEQSYYFSGHFDGNGHTIKGMTIAGVLFDTAGTALEYTEGSTGNVGLFGALGAGASVRNLTLAGAHISGYYNVGGIAGYMGAGARIENCRVIDADIECYNRIAGGIVGATAAEVSDSDPIVVSKCVVSGRVRANNEMAGGIAGDSRALISECVGLAAVSVAHFNACVAAPKLVRAGGIVGSNGGNIEGCLNMGTVSSEGGEAGGLAGYNTNGYHLGCLTANVSAAPVYAADVTNAGALVGLDFRISTSTSSAVIMTANYYDSRYCALRAAGNMDKDGLSPLATPALTGTTLPAGLDGKWTAAEGYYSVPAALASDELVKAAAATYILIEEPYALYNFGTEATVATAMPLTASLAGSAVFAVADDKVTATTTDDYAEATLTLANGTIYSRVLTLVRPGNVLPGSGTEADPYIISSAADFNKLSAYVQTNRFDFDGMYFALAGDIDFEGVALQPLGTAGTYFNGVFDGRNHTMRNIVLNKATGDSDHADAGIFSFLGQTAVVRNLTVDSSVFIGSGTTGAIAGNSFGRIENCTVGADVTVTGMSLSDLSGENGEQIGGVVGKLYQGAVVSGAVSSATVTGYRLAGGIVGASDDAGAAYIEDCTNHGQVTGMAPMQLVIQGGQQVPKYVETMTGGIAGRFTGRISSSVNRGRVVSEVCDAVGGIVGKGFIDVTVSGCANYGTVYTAHNYGGGIIGISTVTTGSEIHTAITDCHNYGSIEGMSSLGGVAGVAANGTSISQCSNHGEVHPLMGRAGGIIGETSGTVAAAMCHNTAHVEGSMLAGGIAGDVPTGATLTVSDSFNTGTVTAGTNGGAAGIANSTAGALTVTDCYNAGDITAARFAGGIAGRSEKVTLTRCYNAARVSSSSDREEYRHSVGNIVADPTADISISNCCWLDTFSGPAADSQLQGARALDIAEMASANEILGDGYVYAPLTLPRLSNFADLDVAKAYAAWYGTSVADDKTSVTLGTPDGVTWSAEGPLALDGDTATATADGKAVLTATCGEYSRSHDIDVTVTAAVGSIVGDKTDATAVYYRLDGVPVASPETGSTVLEVTVDAAGRRHARVVRIVR